MYATDRGNPIVRLAAAAGAALLSAVLALLLFSGAVWARDVAGVALPESVPVGPGGNRLVLNGAGVRKKFFVKVYVGALYLPRTARDATSVFEMPGPKRVVMHFLHSEVSADKIVNGWNEGFSANLGAEELDALRDRLARFNGFFRTVLRGDRILLDYIPGEGTEVRINEDLQGAIEGADFYKALLKVWLGPEPADRHLKEQLLGGSQ